jgi:UDP-N-acetylmuramoyl-tripeptide--D-alanyl-D-alanine ligase
MKVEEIVKVCNGKLLFGNQLTEVSSFSNNSKDIQNECLYLAIKGENSHGNDYINDAFINGAIGVMTDKKMEKYSSGKIIIEVEDTIKAIQELAKYKREMYNIPVVAITGSVRKNQHKGYCCKCFITKV